MKAVFSLSLALLLAGCGLQLAGLGSDEPHRLYLEADTGSVPYETVQTLNALLPYVAAVSSPSASSPSAQLPLATVQLLRQGSGSSRLAVGGGARRAENLESLTLYYRLKLTVPADAGTPDAGQVKSYSHSCTQSDNHPRDEIRSLADGQRRGALRQELARECIVQMRQQALRRHREIRQNVLEQQARQREAEAAEAPQEGEAQQ